MRNPLQPIVALISLVVAVYLLCAKEQYLWGIVALLIAALAAQFDRVLRVALGPRGLEAELRSPDVDIAAKKEVTDKIERLANEMAEARLVIQREVQSVGTRDAMEKGVAIGRYSQILYNLLRLPVPSIRLLHDVLRNSDDSGYTELVASSGEERSQLKVRLQILRFAGIVGDRAHSTERPYNIGVRLSEEALMNRQKLMEDTERRLKTEEVFPTSSTAG